MKPESGKPKCSTYERQEERSKQKENEKAKKQEYKMGRGKKYLFIHSRCNSGDIYYFCLHVIHLWLFVIWVAKTF